MTIIEQRNK